MSNKRQAQGPAVGVREEAAGERRAALAQEVLPRTARDQDADPRLAQGKNTKDRAVTEN